VAAPRAPTPSCRRPRPVCGRGRSRAGYAVVVRAATNKCLARNNKSRTRGGATNGVDVAAGFASCLRRRHSGVRALLVSSHPTFPQAGQRRFRRALNMISRITDNIGEKTTTFMVHSQNGLRVTPAAIAPTATSHQSAVPPSTTWRMPTPGILWDAGCRPLATASCRWEGVKD
jgi:hypothetical protein